MEIKCDNHESYDDETVLRYTLRLTFQEKSIMEAALYDYLQYIRTQKEILGTLTSTDPAEESKRIEGVAFYAERIKIIEEMQKAR